ncbi:DsbA family protein [Streptomyces sp. NPDC102437]|uniref:DsbA family protein n=1 Tax=Streptomyces sp. NPDC102437 TaxID=3366175 RepID=UPI003802BBB4
MSATRSSSPAALQALERRLRRAHTLNVILAAAVVFLLIVAFARSGTGSSATAGPAPDRSSSASSDSADSIAQRDPKDPLAIGPVDAPVVLVEFADLRCPYCAVFTRQTLPTLLKEYVDTGKVRYEFRDVAIFGDQSVDAAVALRAAAAQGRFKQYLTTLYEAAPENKHPDLPRQKLIAFARTAGVPDLKTFEKALDSKTLAQAVHTTTSDAGSLGINSVPFFVAGDQALAGAQPLAAFQQLLDGQLEKADNR